MANWKITTGRLAMGLLMSALKNWLLSAVNNKGAVSPLMRATANNRPVITPLLAARKVTDRDTFHRGAPNANAASRKLPGTKRNMFSVVRMITGTAIKDKAKVDRMIQEILSEREFLVRELKKLPFVQKIHPSHANFLLVQIPNANQVYDDLIEEKVIVRNRAKVLLCADCLRITVGTREENEALLKALSKVVK